ncbi:MAG: C40 family peptidase [Mogibacterium sp.]|nr:C40 family peptidase [Mogibacterium sp.]
MFRKKEKTNNNADINKEKTYKGESYEMVVRHVKRSALVGILASAIVVMIAAWSVMAPYAITINGSTVCYVRNKEAAGKVTDAIIKEYLPEDATMKVFDVSDNINFEAADIKQALSADCVSVADATSMLKDRLENPDDYETAEVTGSPKKVSPFGIVLYVEAADGTTVKAPVDPSITVLSTANVTETFKVPTEYIKDDSMLAGDSEIEAKGNKGKREVLRQFTTVNGEVVKTDDLKVDIVKEAKPKVIRKGTLGLPEGEDWKTYEGDPIFNDGEVLISTAKKYLGAPYKYGGYSLTTGIDCVQFIRQMYAKYGIKLPNGKNALKHVGTAVSFANARPGDIICYSNHYALYMGNNTIIHATSKGGVKIRHNAKFRKIVTVRRIPRS